ncbi:MAG: hypothetical protein U0324_33995 [Polyangiales bacterium]
MENPSSGLEALRAGMHSSPDAGAVLAALRVIPEPRRKPADALERFAFKVRSALGKAARDPLSAQFVVENEAAHALGPAVLDEDEGGRWAWSFTEVLTLPDEDAVAWMGALARLKRSPARLLALAEEVYRARQRGTWMPAAQAIAAAARRDDAARALLLRLWRDGQPNGLAGTTADGRPDDVHAVRHGFYLAMCWLAEGGDPAALDPPLPVDALLARKLPTDAADGSAVLSGLARLLSAPALAERARAAFAKRARESLADDQQEEALRGVLASLHGDPGAAPLLADIAATLREPRWTTARAREAMFDQLWSWTETARCFRDLGRVDDLAAMRTHGRALGVDDLLALALGERAPSAESPGELVEAARAVFDVDAFRLMSYRACAAGSVRLMLLGRAEAFRSLPLASVMSLALRGVPGAPPPSEFDGAVGEALDGALVQHFCAHATRCPKALIRERRYVAPVVERLAAVPNGDVAIQAALQVAALLREAPEPAAALALLWRMVARRPPTDFYVQLGRVLRGRDTPLHRVVADLELLARAEQAGGASAEARVAWAGLHAHLLDAVGGAQELPDLEAPITPRLAFTVLARAMAAGVSLDELPAEGAALGAWLDRLRAIVFGERRGRQGGLCYWSDWVRYGEERDDGERELEVAWEDFAAQMVDFDAVRALDAAGGDDGAAAGLRGLARDYGDARARWSAALDALLAAVERPLETEDALLRVGTEFEDKLHEAADELLPLLRAVRDEARSRFLALRASLERVKSFFAWLAWPERRVLASFVDALLQRIDARRLGLEALVAGELRAVRGELLDGRRARFEALRALRQGELADSAFARAEAALHAAFRAELDGWLAQGREGPVVALARRLQRGRAIPVAEAAAMPGWGDGAGDAARVLTAMPGGAEAVLAVTAGECQRVGQFLLRHLLFAEARRFHAEVRAEDVNVPSVQSYFVPLFANLAGGAFLVLDVGTVWDQTLAENALRPGYWWVTATSLVASLALFYQGLAVAVPDDGAGGGEGLLGRRGVRLFLRVLPPWGASLAFASGVAGFMLWTLQGTGEYMTRHPLLQALLWGGLSLFLGVFLNVTLQDKKFVRGEE